MRIRQAHRRLYTCWGEVDKMYNALIARRVVGKRVIDIGCGYGTLVEYLSRKGFETVGVDTDPRSIEVAKCLHTQADIREGNAQEIDFEDGSFDTVVFRDTIHHIVGEGESATVFAEVKRVLVPYGTIVVLDPNPNWILRTARRLAKHEDPEASLELVTELLVHEGFHINNIAFYEIFGLALSGGYVGLRWVPNVCFLNRLVAKANDAASNAVFQLGLGRVLCWRYIIQAHRCLN